MSRRLILSVVGDGTVVEGSPQYEQARRLGQLAVSAGFRVASGGLGGVMEAACRGAHESPEYREGDTLGLLPGSEPDAANPWVDIPIATGLGHLRNALVAKANIIVAIGGKAGTLSEIALAWLERRPIIALGDSGWSGTLAGSAVDDRRLPDDPAGDRVHAAESAEEAIRIAAELGRQMSSRRA
ncbi:MAG: TIGR00725 family protein [Polyangiaceae bacterium]|nr:TIGR00725 family protein [Polyangiaceae bacterium]